MEEMLNFKCALKGGINKLEGKSTSFRGWSINFKYNKLVVIKMVKTALDITNPSDAIKQIDEDERARLNLGRQGEAWTATRNSYLYPDL